MNTIISMMFGILFILEAMIQHGLSGIWAITNSKTIYFVNSGDTSISPIIYYEEDVELTDSDGTIYNLKRGENKEFSLTLYQGINYFKAKGKRLDFNAF